jgi:hypothetical protein
MEYRTNLTWLCLSPYESTMLLVCFYLNFKTISLIWIGCFLACSLYLPLKTEPNTPLEAGTQPLPGSWLGQLASLPYSCMLPNLQTQNTSNKRLPPEPPLRGRLTTTDMNESRLTTTDMNEWEQAFHWVPPMIGAFIGWDSNVTASRQI